MSDLEALAIGLSLMLAGFIFGAIGVALLHNREGCAEYVYGDLPAKWEGIPWDSLHVVLADAALYASIATDEYEHVITVLDWIEDNYEPGVKNG